jgi:hypothetical protein
MQKTQSGYIYSPSDLIAFLENECVTWLDRYDAEFPGMIHRDEPAEQDWLFQSVGEKYEAGILEDLKTKQDVAIIERSDEGLRQPAHIGKQGNISRGSRTWLVRVSLVRDPETGTQKYHNKPFADHSGKLRAI